MRDLSRPAAELELIDDPLVGEVALREALDDIELSNRLLGGTAASFAALRPLVERAAAAGRRPVRVLDVGAGGCGTALRLCAWARRRGLEVRVLACDLSAHAARHAHERGRKEPWLHVVRADAFRPPLADGSVDVVHAALFLHHVPRAEQAAMLRRLAGLAVGGLCVVDLVRSRWAHEGVRLFGWASRRGPLFRHDAPLSVARGFTIEEARRLARDSGVPGLTVRRHAFSRLSWSARLDEAAPA